MNILIVDDNEIILNTLKFTLEDTDYNIFVASDGIDGLNLFKNNKFNLVITDIIMPKMDGIEFIRQLKKFDKNIKIIVMSGGDLGPIFTDIALEFGAIMFLEVIMIQIVQVLKKILDCMLKGNRCYKNIRCFYIYKKSK